MILYTYVSQLTTSKIDGMTFSDTSEDFLQLACSVSSVYLTQVLITSEDVQ